MVCYWQTQWWCSDYLLGKEKHSHTLPNGIIELLGCDLSGLFNRPGIYPILFWLKKEKQSKFVSMYYILKAELPTDQAKMK